MAKLRSPVAEFRLNSEASRPAQEVGQGVVGVTIGGGEGKNLDMVLHQLERRVGLGESGRVIVGRRKCNNLRDEEPVGIRRLDHKYA